MTSDALAGFGVIVTRPAAQADELVRGIEDVGGNVVRFPVIDITARSDADIAADFAQLPEPDLVVFISHNAAAYGHSIISGQSARIAAIGPATAGALAESGIAVDIVPIDGFDSEHLLALPALRDVGGLSVTIVRATSGRELLAKTLISRGANVNYLAVYERSAHSPDDSALLALENALDDGSVQCLTVMSVESLRNFLQLLPASCGEKLRETLLVAPGNRVIQTAKELIPGIATAQAPGPRVADIVNTLIAFRQSGQDS